MRSTTGWLAGRLVKMIIGSDDNDRDIDYVECGSHYYGLHLDKQSSDDNGEACNIPRSRDFGNCSFPLKGSHCLTQLADFVIIHCEG